MRRAWTLFSLGLFSQDASARDPIATVQNANHIFNAVHSSMRQWGSSLNHNGMSVFVATVPKGTELYHGTSEASQINGTEWLAFEPEHALVFARPRGRGPPPGKGGPPGPNHQPHNDGGEEDWHPPERLSRDQFMPWHRDTADEEFEPRHPPHKDGPPTHGAGQREHTRLPAQQHPFFVEEESPEEESYGYLHTYAPKKDLRLLYVDGQSAAKSSKGTLDLQDIVLLHDNPPPKDHDGPPRSRDGPPKDRRPHPGGPMGESYRAQKLCELANTEWEGRIDGILRMELGFEIILCSFERDLEVKHITQTKSSGMPGGPPGHGNDGDGLAYYQAVASRFDGIGGNRVTLDYGNFVSLFNFKDAIYFDDKGLPRVRNESSVLRPVNSAIKKMILQESAPDHIDWRAVVDMVVSRYSDRIEYMNSGDIDDLHSLKAEAERLLRPYVDYGNRNKTTEIQRCATQYMPELSSPESLAGISMLNVTKTICSSLSDVSEAPTYEEAFVLVQDLKSWLTWTTWKRCRGCDAHEVCFVPIWPMGGKKEHEHPACVSNMSDVSRGYWDDGMKWAAYHKKNRNELR